MRPTVGSAALTAVCVLALTAACSSAKSPSSAPSPSTPVVRTTPPARPTPTSSLVITTAAGPTHFSAPDRSIGCDVESAYARCDAAHHTWQSTPMPSDCHEKWGFGVEYSLGGKGSFFCADDSVLGAPNVLAVGHAIRVGLVECDSLRAGISCHGVGAPGGFIISPTAYRLF